MRTTSDALTFAGGVVALEKVEGQKFRHLVISMQTAVTAEVGMVGSGSGSTTAKKACAVDFSYIGSELWSSQAPGGLYVE